MLWETGKVFTLKPGGKLVHTDYQMLRDNVNYQCQIYVKFAHQFQKWLSDRRTYSPS
jgi:hypothetical protein